jgi:non-heme chloroperoxidase
MIRAKDTISTRFLTMSPPSSMDLTCRTSSSLATPWVRRKSFDIWTRHRSRRVSRAVLIAPTTPFNMKTDDNPSGKSRETLEKTLELLRRDLPRLTAQAAPEIFGAPKNSVSQETKDWWCRMFLDRCSIKVLSELFKVMNETDFRPELRTIRTPTLILQGEIDKLTPLELHGRPTHEFIAGSQMIVYENAAHGLPYTHTDRMLTDIVAFAGA